MRARKITGIKEISVEGERFPSTTDVVE